jgi:hypothetical protein
MIACRWCGKDMGIPKFRSELSVKEYHVSGMCQECQDKWRSSEMTEAEERASEVMQHAFYAVRASLC